MRRASCCSRSPWRWTRRGRLGSAGPPVLLLHGFPDSSELWRDVAPLLVAEGYRVVAPDLDGLGASVVAAIEKQLATTP